MTTRGIQFLREASTRPPRWLVYSLLTIVLWGTWGAVSKVVTDDIDAYRSQILFTLGLFPLVVFVLASQRAGPGPQRKKGIFFAFVTGILGGTGNIAFFEALSLGGKASIVVPMTAMSPLVTVLLARVFLRERLSRTQAFGLVLALAAIYLLSL